MSVILFTVEKRRADSPDAVAYSYADEAGISYDQKLASVRRVDPDDLEDLCVTDTEVADHRVVITILKLIDNSFVGGKMALARMAAEDCGVSHRRALAILELRTGTTVGEHYWTFSTGARGVRHYTAIALS